MRFALAVVFSVLVSACGSGGGGGGDGASEENNDDDGDEQETVTHAQLVATAADLPDCDADAEGLLVYVKADKNFKACSSKKWATIDLKGEDGKDGADASYKIATTFACGDTLASTSYYVSYQTSIMSNGDAFVTGSVSGTDYEASASEFYSVNQNGSTNNMLVLGYYDAAADDSGFWTFELDRTTEQLTLTYNNVGDAAHGTEYTIDCPKTEY